MKWAVDTMKWYFSCLARSRARGLASTTGWDWFHGGDRKNERRKERKTERKINQITVFKQFVIKIYWTDSQMVAKLCVMCMRPLVDKVCVENEVHLSWLEDILPKFTFKFAWYYHRQCAHTRTHAHIHIKIQTIVSFYWARGDSCASSLVYFFSLSPSVDMQKKYIPYGSSDRFDFRVSFCRFLICIFFAFLRNESRNCHSWFQFGNKNLKRQFEE